MYVGLHGTLRSERYSNSGIVIDLFSADSALDRFGILEPDDALNASGSVTPQPTLSATLLGRRHQGDELF